MTVRLKMSQCQLKSWIRNCKATQFGSDFKVKIPARVEYAKSHLLNVQTV